MVETRSAAARGNQILEKLPPPDRTLVAAVVERVVLVPGQVICSAGKKIRHVLFPRDGVILLSASFAGEADVGVATVGAAGMFGFAVAAGRLRSGLTASSQGQGSADRIESGAFLQLLERSARLRASMLVAGHEQTMQMARNTACVLRHPLQRRLARWMLDVTDGLRSARLSSTQDAMAIALGVQRPALSRTAGALQRHGLIGYVRGEVRILDRPGLAALACGCSRAPGLIAAM